MHTNKIKQSVEETVLVKVLLYFDPCNPINKDLLCLWVK